MKLPQSKKEEKTRAPCRPNSAARLLGDVPRESLAARVLRCFTTPHRIDRKPTRPEDGAYTGSFTGQLQLH
jgi:hypothetical protein